MPRQQPLTTPTEPSLHDRARSYIYDQTVTASTTSRLYRLLHLLPEATYLLLIGIGTGTALITHSHLLRSKRITVLALESDPSYSAICRHRLHESGLNSSVVKLIQSDISDFAYKGERLFNNICFINSFGRLQDAGNTLGKVVEWLVDREVGRVYFGEEFELTKNGWREWIQPKLGSVTGVAMGNVCYEADFEEAVRSAGLVIERWEVLEDGCEVEGVREGRLVVTRSGLYVTEEKETPA